MGGKADGFVEAATSVPSRPFVTSWAFAPGVLAAIRATLSLYAFVTLFTIFGYNGAHGLSEDSARSFSYFTHLTYWGLAFYFLFAALHTSMYTLTGKSTLERWPRALQTAHSIFYSTITVYPWIVTIVFWALLYSRFDSVFTTWTNASQHALNAVYAFFEIVFPNTRPLPFLHMIAIIIILGMYLGLAYVTYATEDFYVYDFLDTQTNSSGKVAGYIVGILVASIVVFLIVRYLILLRVWLTETKLHMYGKLSRRDQTAISVARGRDVEKTGRRTDHY